MEYKIDFYYNTELRCTETVTATNEILALLKALDNIGHSDDCWIDNKNFEIKISAT